MKSAKYIVIVNREIAEEKMIIFPHNIKHSDMAKAMEVLGYDYVVSAGFIDDYLQCYGESASLMMKRSRKKVDTDLLRKTLDIDDKELLFSDYTWKRG
jgi:hypothetical protein